MRTVLASLVCLLVIAAQPAQIRAQASHDMSLLGRWTNGPCRALAAEGTLVAVGNGAALELLSLAPDGATTTLGKVAVPDLVVHVALADTLALLACGDGGLQVISVSDPSAPRLIGAWDGGHSVNAVVSGGRYVFVAEDSVSLRVIDLQDPSSPQSVYGPASPVRRTAITKVGDHVYVGDSGGDLFIYDVADARHPAFTDWYGDSGDVFDIHVFGGYAYLAQGPLGLLVIDVHDPYNIDDVGRLAIPAGWALGVTVADGAAYVAAAGGGLRVIDTADFGAMAEVDSLMTGGYASDVAVVGGLAVMADSWPGVRIIDVGAPAALLATVVARADASRIVLDGAVSAIIDRDTGLRLLTDGATGPPLELSTMPLPRACDVAMSGGLVAVARERDGLTLIDVGDPTAPDSLTTVDTDGLARAVVFARGRAWLADGDGGLRIYDLTDPAAPVQEGHLQVGSDLFALAPHGDLMILLDRSDGLVVIEASSPAAPTPLGLLDLPGEPTALAVADGYVYVTAGDEGLRVISLAEPGDPVEVLGLALPGAQGVAVANGYAAVAAGSRGLRLLDLDDPAAPVETAWFVTGSATGAAYRDRRVHLADGFGGVLVLKNDIPAAVEIHDLSAERVAGGVQLRWRGGGAASIQISRLAAGSEPVILGATDDAAWFDPTAPARAVTYSLANALRPGVTLARIEAVPLRGSPATSLTSHPNPANPICSINYELARPADVDVGIYDLRGRRVRTLLRGGMPSGRHGLTWDGRDDRGGQVPSGAYVIRLLTGDHEVTGRVLLVR